MNLLNLLKLAFPKPIIPQKRYMALGVFAVWALLKVYTMYTPSTEDDSWPDTFSSAAQIVLSSDDSSPSSDQDSEDDSPVIVKSGAYGESN